MLKTSKGADDPAIVPLDQPGWRALTLSFLKSVLQQSWWVVTATAQRPSWQLRRVGLCLLNLVMKNSGHSFYISTLNWFSSAINFIEIYNLWSFHDGKTRTKLGLPCLSLEKHSLEDLNSEKYHAIPPKLLAIREEKSIDLKMHFFGGGGGGWIRQKSFLDVLFTFHLLGFKYALSLPLS